MPRFEQPPSCSRVSVVRAKQFGVNVGSTHLLEDVREDEEQRVEDWYQRCLVDYARRVGTERLAVYYRCSKRDGGLWDIECRLGEPSDRRIELE